MIIYNKLLVSVKKPGFYVKFVENIDKYQDVDFGLFPSTNLYVTRHLARGLNISACSLFPSNAEEIVGGENTKSIILFVPEKYILPYSYFALPSFKSP